MRRIIVLIQIIGISILVLLVIPSLTVKSPTSSTPPAPCPEDQVQAALAAVPMYAPSQTAGFVRLEHGRFTVGGKDYAVGGVNYYPARYPWRRFLTESELPDMQHELVLLKAIGFNTLRLFLWNEALFICPSNGAIPSAAAFQRLDSLIWAAAAQGFRLIVTLNDLPDMTDFPLYSDPLLIQQQTHFIIERYHEEAAILAWDLRNEGDIDYRSNKNGEGVVSREAVLKWLAQTSERVRRWDNHHLITAGWLHDAESTAPYVDFVGFHHWWDTNDLRTWVAALRAQTDKPILLEEFGYSTARVTPDEQSRLIGEAIQTVGDEHLLGWLIWTAFDFPLDATCIRPACPSQDNAEHHFGLWYADYVAKPAVQMIRDLPG